MIEPCEKIWMLHNIFMSSDPVLGISVVEDSEEIDIIIIKGVTGCVIIILLALLLLIHYTSPERSRLGPSRYKLNYFNQFSLVGHPSLLFSMLNNLFDSIQVTSFTLNLIRIIIIVIPLFISIAYLTLAERKTLSYMQQRKGPNVVGIYGLLQPLADGIKLFTNEAVIPNNINLTIYILAPVLSLTLALVV